MFRKILGAMGLGGVFEKSAEEPIDARESDYSYGDMKAAYLPEIKQYKAPLLHVISSRSSGVMLISGQTDDVTFQDEKSGEAITIPKDEGSFEFPENKANLVISLLQYSDFNSVRKEIEMWSLDDAIPRIGQQKVQNDDASHIITIVPANYTSDTLCERIKLDDTTGEDGWSYLEQKFNELKDNSPGPTLE